MPEIKKVFNPIKKGLSVSALELWLVDKVAYELSYFHNLEPVEPWNKNTGYGNLIGAGIEGYIKTKDIKAINSFVNAQFQKAIKVYDNYRDLAFYSSVAAHQAKVFVERYKKDFDKYGIVSAEDKVVADITLPSKRIITISGRFDGMGVNNFFEHKCRGDWNTEAIANEIDLNLQYNFYLLLFYSKYNKLPSVVWYQHSRRPGGFGYRGPKQKTKESNEEYINRLNKYISDNANDHFYQFISKPNIERFRRFLNKCLYPILEQFCDWYEYMTSNNKDKVNKYHYFTPYGLYNPFIEGTAERFRNFAITGSTIGLKRKSNGYNNDKEKSSKRSTDKK